MTLAEQLVASVKKANGGRIPYAGKEKGKAKRDRLPVPPPKGATGPSIVADPKKEGIPVELQVQNRTPLTPEQQANVDAVMAKTQEPAKKQADLRAQQKAAATDKSRVRVEKLLAKKSGATAAMPLTGKAALRAIADAAVEAGHPIQRVAEPKKPLTGKSARQAMRRADKALKAEKRAARTGTAVRAGSKAALIADLLRRKGGCTTADVLKATGWPSVSMPAQAIQAGVKLRKEKKPGSPTVYYAA